MSLIQHQMPYFRSEAVRLYTVVMALVFLFSKLIIRRITKQLAGVPFDTKDAIAWFGVDLSVLCLSIWVAAGLPARIGLSSQESTMSYVVLMLLIFMTAASYKRYLRVSANVQPGVWYTIKVFSQMTICLFWGFVGLLGTVRAL